VVNENIGNFESGDRKYPRVELGFPRVELGFPRVELLSVWAIEILWGKKVTHFIF